MESQDIASQLALAKEWSFPTGCSLLTWFVFASQWQSTLSVMKKESGGYTLPLIAIFYLFTLAFIAS
jgi:ferrous iron transport protein B